MWVSIFFAFSRLPKYFQFQVYFLFIHLITIDYEMYFFIILWMGLEGVWSKKNFLRGDRILGIKSAAIIDKITITFYEFRVTWQICTCENRFANMFNEFVTFLRFSLQRFEFKMAINVSKKILSSAMNI